MSVAPVQWMLGSRKHNAAFLSDETVVVRRFYCWQVCNIAGERWRFKINVVRKGWPGHPSNCESFTGRVAGRGVHARLSCLTVLLLAIHIDIESLASFCFD